MIDYYTYWAERRADYWNRIADKFINKFLRWFAIVWIAIILISPELAVAIMAVYIVILIGIAIPYGLAVGRYGKAVDHMAYSGYSGDRREVN